MTLNLRKEIPQAMAMLTTVIKAKLDAGHGEAIKLDTIIIQWKRQKPTVVVVGEFKEGFTEAPIGVDFKTLIEPVSGASPHGEPYQYDLLFTRGAFEEVRLFDTGFFKKRKLTDFRKRMLRKAKILDEVGLARDGIDTTKDRQLPISFM